MFRHVLMIIVAALIFSSCGNDNVVLGEGNADLTEHYAQTRAKYDNAPAAPSANLLYDKRDLINAFNSVVRNTGAQSVSADRRWACVIHRKQGIDDPNVWTIKVTFVREHLIAKRATQKHARGFSTQAEAQSFMDAVTDLVDPFEEQYTPPPPDSNDNDNNDEDVEEQHTPLPPNDPDPKEGESQLDPPPDDQDNPNNGDDEDVDNQFTPQQPDNNNDNDDDDDESEDQFTPPPDDPEDPEEGGESQLDKG